MDVLIDTVSMVHLLRHLRRERVPIIEKIKTCIDDPMIQGRLIVVLDSDGGLQSEWETTLGVDLIRQLIIHWAEMKGVRKIKALANISNVIMNRLRSFGFRGTVDKLIVRLAYQTTTRKWFPTIPIFGTRVKDDLWETPAAA